MHPKADHFAFQVSDLKKAMEFYRDILGLSQISETIDQEHQEAFAFFELDGGNLELLQKVDEEGNPADFDKSRLESPYCPHLALACDDLDQMIAQLQEKQIPIIKGPLEIPNNVKWLYIADPDNNVIEFVEWLDKSD